MVDCKTDMINIVFSQSPISYSSPYLILNHLKIRDDSYKICHDDSSERCVIEDEMIEDEIDHILVLYTISF